MRVLTFKKLPEWESLLRSDFCRSLPLSCSDREHLSPLVFSSDWRGKMRKRHRISFLIVLERNEILKTSCVELYPGIISLFRANLWELLLRRDSHRREISFLPEIRYLNSSEIRQYLHKYHDRHVHQNVHDVSLGIVLCHPLLQKE